MPQSSEPFLQAIMRILKGHYGGQPPQQWLQRLAPQLNMTPEGRRFLGSLSLGQDPAGAQFRSVQPLASLAPRPQPPQPLPSAGAQSPGVRPRY